MKIIFIKKLIKGNHVVKKLSKYVAAFDYIDKVLIVLSVKSGGVYTLGTIVNIFIVSELGASGSHNNDPTQKIVYLVQLL